MSTNKTFNKVQLDVKFTQAATRANLISEENISISFGKISKYFADLHSQAFTGYTHPTYTAHSSGLYKITVDSKGHVSAATAATKADIPTLDYLPNTTKYALSDSVGGSAKTADKLTNARTIAIGTGVTSTATSFDGSANITIPVTGIKEAYLTWGGKDFTSSFSPLDAALEPRLGANRLEMCPGSGIKIERTTDGGTTWTEVSTSSISNAQRSALFSSAGYTVPVSATSTAGMGSNAAKYMMRITLDTSVANVYTNLLKFILNISTSGCANCYVKLRIRTAANVSAGNDTWLTWDKTNKTWSSSPIEANTKCPISGWSGYNVINFTTFTTYGNQTSHYRNIQFIFGCSQNDSTYPGLSIINIQGYGGVAWNAPSNMARTGHLYSWNGVGDASFPSSVTATNFNGKLNTMTISGTNNGSYNLNNFLTEHPIITKSTDTTSTASPGHGGTFTVVDSITRETNGHVTKINTKTVTLPADSNTDTLVSQTFATASYKRPLLMSYYKVGEAAGTAQVAYRNDSLYCNPSNGRIFATGFYTSGWDTSPAATSASLQANGLVLRAIKTYGDGHTLDYNRYVVRTYSGKTGLNTSDWSSNGMLVTVEGGGLTIVGGGESAASLAGLISDDYLPASGTPNSLDVNGDTTTGTGYYHTSLSGSSENLILSADTEIYFVTNANTIANRKAARLTSDLYFAPLSTNTGSIGTSTYQWNTVFGKTIYENGTSLASKYAAIGHTHGLLHSDLTQVASNGTTGGWSVIGIDPAVNGYVLKSIRINETSPNWLSGGYGAGIAFGGYDTKGVISMRWDSPVITFAGGNHKSTITSPKWYFKISGTSGSTYNLANFYDSTISRTANTVLAAPNGSDGGATFRKLVAADLPSHTHNYAGSSSVGGPATSVATEVGNTAGARPVFYAYLGDNTRVVYNTNFTYNPSGNVLTATKFVGALDGTASQAIKLRSSAARTDSTVDTADTTPYQKYWVKIASCYTTENYTDLESLWAVNDVYGNRQGILKVRARVEDTAGTFGNTRTIRWIVADNDIDVNRFAIVCYNNRKPDGTTASGTATVELWWKSTAQYASFSFVLLDETRRTGKQPNDWVLYDTSTYGQAALPTTGNITYSVAATILNSTTGTSSNVTGTVAIANGGTGATNRLAALRALTEQDVGTSAQYFLTITNSWGKGGYTSVANVKTVLGLKSAAYTESTSYIPMSGSMGVTGNIEITKASGDVGFYAKRSDTGVEVWMGVGSGGTNHGIYSNKLGKWMMYGDATNVYLNGNAATATKLATARTINGVSFDGSADITIPRNIKHIHTASGTEGSAGWVKIARITVTNLYANHPMTFTIAQRGLMQYRIHLVLVNNGSVAAAAISQFIIARDNSWTDTNNNPRAYIIKPSDGVFDLYIRKTEAYDHIFVVDFTKADNSEGDNYSVAWTNVHAADSAITGGTEAVKKLYLPSTTNYAGSSSVGGAATNVTGTLTNPTSETSYAVPFHTNPTTGSKSLLNNNGISYVCKEGTASALGWGILLLGNNVNSGTAGNKYGIVRMYPQTGNYYGQIRPVATLTGTRTYQLPDASGNVILGTKGSTSFWGLIDGDASTSNWIRATSNGFIPSAAAKFFQTATSSLGTNTWYFKNSYIQYMNANSLVLGAAKTADGAAKGQVKFFSGNESDATGTVTLECADDAVHTGDYTVKLPTWNGTIPIFEKLFEGASNTVSLSYSDIDEYDVFLITVANSNATTEQVTVTSLWISNVAGLHDMPLIWGGAPTSSGGACNVTSGWIQLSKNSGTTTFVVAHKPSVAQMTSSGWTISSPTYNLYIRKIFGLKAYKRT